MNMEKTTSPLLETLQHYNKWLSESMLQIARREVQPIVIETRLNKLKSEVLKPGITIETTGAERFLIEKEHEKFRVNVGTLETMIADRKAVERYKHISMSFNQQQGDQQNNRENEYPSELDTPKTRYILNKLAEDGIIIRDGVFYGWVKPKSHFGFFVIIGNFYLWNRQYKRDTLKWKPFLSAFRINNRDEKNIRSKVSDSIDSCRDLKPSHPAYYIIEEFEKYTNEWEKMGSNNQ